MGKETGALITVVYPMIDVRGRAVDRVRTWTQGQSLARERYHVVVACDGSAPAEEDEVARLLGPADALIRVPGGRDGDLWNAGAHRAVTRWVVITEGHCPARPGCLAAVARWIATDPRAAVGTFTIDHSCDYLMARLSRDWFGEVQASWRAPGSWPRLHRSGSAIRADVLAAAGGFEAEYGQFAPALLSARLHASGVRFDAIPDASVLHDDSRCMRDHHADTADFARGEMDARARNDPWFFERYFGHAPLWANQLREGHAGGCTMLGAITAAALAQPARAAELAARLSRPALAAIAGIRSRVAFHRLAVALDEAIVERLPLPSRWRRARFLRAHRRVVRLEQLAWICARTPSPAAGSARRWPIERLGPGTLVGAHALEEHRGRLFRWTEPEVLLRLPAADEAYEVRIETAGIRPDPLGAVVAVVAAGRALPRALLSADGDCVVIRVPRPWLAAAGRGLVLVCSALVPARGGSPDRRLLGLPIRSIQVVPSAVMSERTRAA